MNIRHVDLNLLVYLNVLIDEQSVSKAANKLALTQPAMSNALKRLRDLFDDPLLVRAAGTMTPTAKALSLKPEIESLLKMAEEITQPSEIFDPSTANITFRIMANDYLESTLIAPFITQQLAKNPGLNFDILSPSDVNLQDMEKGTIDLAINRFNGLPRSFHQASVWRDNYCCLTHPDNPYLQQQNLEGYLAQEHIWVNRAGWGVEAAVTNKSGSQKLGWVDEALWQLEQTRNIRVFTRHYMVASLLCQSPKLIATLPRRQAMLLAKHTDLVISPVPFQIVPIEVKMLWSPLLHHANPHQWLRRELLAFAGTVADR
ncbi:LysR family transcriptional regulator [Pseudoalteromonas sp. SSMSWG5]|jgi:DNA-binding transcriptional LysR family regulator|uniref:LysR family transcriptional regulator n=1 Tax=unclassified Pseudoalteromonas TaxID=194690 RepID=UPI000CF64B67|nr:MULTISPECIES: LysR family transcriptional regulator [unclassified Pseudoalteromonas]MCF2902402.1 LysR family transcriptional regulator [Pseudoalteromonas sp. OFAV1]TMO45082.1 LysR family transcriptional regulator [Pseudoalteromonas sp. S4389]